MSFSSGGLSFRNVEHSHGYGNNDNNHTSNTIATTISVDAHSKELSCQNEIYQEVSSVVQYENQNKYSSKSTSCCYNKCYKKTYFKGYLVCGTCKSSFDCGMFSLVSLFITTLLLAVIVPVVINAIIDDVINTQVVVDSTNAPNYDAWQTNIHGPGTDIKIGYDIYFFDVQNPQEILQGQKPVVVEVGPYAFNEFYDKFDITWSDGGDTVTYNTQRYYLFDSDRTAPGLSQDDQLTLPYATALGFQYLLSGIPYNLSVLVETRLLSVSQQLYETIEYDLNLLDLYVMQNPSPQNIAIHMKIQGLERQIKEFHTSLSEFITYSNPADLLLKSLLCSAYGQALPFWTTTPVPAYFGWLNDPVLLEVQNLLDLVALKNGTVIPWSTAVPGITINYTSIAETKRRRGMDTLKTGKKDSKQVSQYVRYNNMTELWSCVSPMSSQNTSQYVEGEQFPACAHYQYEWSSQEAEAMGYVHPFRTNYANRIEGSDANMFGRPVTTDKLQVFISDIYRSCYLKYSKDTDWYGVKARRYELQIKDLQNYTTNPENAQYYNYGPSGMENLTAAAGIPSWASFPNFLHAQSSLIAAVKGLQPNAEIHTSYLDIEPQTGLLVRAQKRLQLNYQMTSQTFPNVPNTTAALAHSICESYANIIDLITSEGVKLNASAPFCNNTMVQQLFTCLAVPSDWIYQNNQVFMPYAWVQEYFTLPQSDADDLSNSLFSIQTFATQFQFWGFIIGGILGSMIATAIFTRYYMVKELVSSHGSGIEDEMDYSYHRAPDDMDTSVRNISAQSNPLSVNSTRQNLNPVI